MQSGDAILMDRMVAGDADALAEAFDRFGPLVYGLARRITRNSPIAEDVVQEVFSALWSHPDRYDPERGSLRAFLGVQAYRRAVDTVRQDMRRSAKDHRPLVAPNEEVDAEAEAKELSDIVRQAIDRLPAAQRQAVKLAYFDGYTQRELASALGIPEGTAKSRLRLAHAKLGQWLSPDLLMVT